MFFSPEDEIPRGLEGVTSTGTKHVKEEPCILQTAQVEGSSQMTDYISWYNVRNTQIPPTFQTSWKYRKVKEVLHTGSWEYRKV
jgi:hypothetical protein